MADYCLLFNVLGLAACAVGFVAIFQATREQHQRDEAELDVRTFLDLDSPARTVTPARQPDPRTTLKPRIVERADGFAYVVLERPTPQKGLSQ